VDLKRKVDINGKELCNISPFFPEKKMVYCGIQNVVKTKAKKYYEIPDIVLQKFMR
jgi:5'(3')-deoxyribonucleotidase